MSEHPKEEAIDFADEIEKCESALALEYPAVIQSKYYKAVKGFIRAQTAQKYTDMVFDSVANKSIDGLSGQTGQGGTCQKPGEPVLTMKP